MGIPFLENKQVWQFEDIYRIFKFYKFLYVHAQLFIYMSHFTFFFICYFHFHLPLSIFENICLHAFRVFLIQNFRFPEFSTNRIVIKDVHHVLTCVQYFYKINKEYEGPYLVKK